jgi:hypothetical protein
LCNLAQAVDIGFKKIGLNPYGFLKAFATAYSTPLFKPGLSPALYGVLKRLIVRKQNPINSYIRH